MSAVAAMGNVSAAQMMQVGGCLGGGYSGSFRRLGVTSVVCPTQHYYAQYAQYAASLLTLISL